MNMHERNWYAIYVKSRYEFVTDGELKKKGIENYLPLVTQLRQWKDRRKSVKFPLFPGYLFVHTSPDPEALYNVLRTRGVVKFVSLVPGHPSPVPHEEIESLRLLIESGRELDVYPNLHEGMMVRVKRGPLKGAVGVLKSKGVHYMFHINIEILGRSVGVKLYADDLEAA